jgi:hypothetical protein
MNKHVQSDGGEPPSFVRAALLRVGALPLIFAFAALSQAQPASGFNGARIMLLNSSGNGYAAAYGGNGEVYSSPNASTWEEWEVWDINGGDICHGDVIGLRTRVGRTFLSDDGGARQAVANRTSCGGWEKWRVYRKSGGTTGVTKVNQFDLVYFRSTVHGTYLSTRYNQAGVPIGAYASSKGTWEQFKWIEIHNNYTTTHNCVEYARLRLTVSVVPTGMTTGQEKLSKCLVTNGSNYWSAQYLKFSDLRVGDMVVIRTGAIYGHVAVVEQKHSDGTVTIREGNWKPGLLTGRRNTPAMLKIIGANR